MRKTIVLLSDGTGNSAASPFKTNVWRLYQALDLSPQTDPNVPQQVVYYDDGVGTETFKPLAALGGALGIGVWKNVRDLYTFVCRNYDIGDQIFGFGFSRGAFTIRLLMGLIGKCGIVKTEPHSEARLLEAVQMAYEAYRRDFLLRASVRNHLIYHWVLSWPRYLLDDAGEKTNLIDLSAAGEWLAQHFIDIPFVGVWDTVDAYGMPVDELKLAIDRWVWPMSFADRDPSRRIRRIRHALSLDDERPTFRPVLWNEVLDNPRSPDKPDILGPETIQQVWFAGVHANVGGGYPDDGLAHVALAWMMKEAEAAGLRFSPHARPEINGRVNPHGQQYDSRSGVAGYYRYGPRKVEALCNDAEHRVNVPRVWLHVDAFDRIARLQRDYAPVSLNCPFQLIGGNPSQYPPPEWCKPDVAMLERAWDIVWWRRLAYFATLATTGFVLLFFAGLALDWPNRILDCSERVLAGVLTTTVAEAAGWLLRQGSQALSVALPGWAMAALPSLARYPLTAVLSLALLAALFFWASRALQRRIALYAEWAWDAQKGLVNEAYLPQPTWLNAIAKPGRKVTAWLYRIWRQVVVHGLGIVIGLAALVAYSPIWIFRVLRRRPWMASWEWPRRERMSRIHA